MKIYKVYVTDWGYDEYDSHIVIAKNPQEARMIGRLRGKAIVREIKLGKKSRIVLSSFNAG